MTSMKPEVIVIGQNTSIILGQVRALGQAGYKVHVLKTTDTKPKKKTYELYSKYISTYGYISKSNEEKFIQLLLNKYADANTKKVLIPCDDNSISFFDHHCQELLPYFVFPNVKYENGRISFFMNKATQKNLANQCGLNTPKGWTIEWCDGKYNIPDDIEYPCFVKPEVYHVARKVLMRKCSNRMEVDELMKICPKGLPMLVEQYIDIEQEYSVTGISINGKAMTTSIVKNFNDHLGVACSGTLAQINMYPNLLKKLNKFIENLSYTGIFCIDLYDSKGKMYFCECNLRLGNSGVATLLNGINLPAMLVDALTGKDTNLYAPAFEPKFFVDERVFIQKYWSKEISWKEYHSSLKKAELRYIQDNEDGKPYKIFCKGITKSKITRLIRKIIFLK